MKKIIYLMLSIFFLVITIANAGLIYKANDPADIQVPCLNNGTLCSNTASCNITIFSINGSLVTANEKMTNQYAFNNYTLFNTSNIGTYRATMICDDNGRYGYSNFEFKITGNGKEEASGIVIVLFAIIFMALMLYLIVLLLKGIGHIIEKDFDIIDLAFNWGGYFCLLALYMLERFYLGNLDIEGFLIIFIDVGAITHMMAPFIAFILCVIRNRRIAKENA